MEYIQADIWVRFQRMQARSHFVGADDTHGAPIMLKPKRSMTPQALSRRSPRRDRSTWPASTSASTLAFDRFAETSSCRRTSTAS